MTRTRNDKSVVAPALNSAESLVLFFFFFFPGSWITVSQLCSRTWEETERCRTRSEFSYLDVMQFGGKRKKEIKIKRLELLFCHSLKSLSVIFFIDSWLFPLKFVELMGLLKCLQRKTLDCFWQMRWCEFGRIALENVILKITCGLVGANIDERTYMRSYFGL